METARPLARAIRKGPRPLVATRHSERMDPEGAGRRMIRLVIALLLCCAPWVQAQTQQSSQPEPSLADQARTAAKAKENAKHAKVITDNDAVEEKKQSNGPFPELGTLPVDWAGVTEASHQKAGIIVEKMVQFIATHAKDEAKR